MLFPVLFPEAILVQAAICGALRLLIKEARINRFLLKTLTFTGWTLLNRCLKSWFSYEVSPEDIRNIPAKGHFDYVANHPLGGLDGLACYI